MYVYIYIYLPRNIMSIPLLNFRGVQGPTFKLSEGSQVTRSRVLGSWSYFYTMPFSYLFHDYDVTSLENIYSITF